MSKVALITDLHFGVKKNSDIFMESQVKFLIEQFIPYLKENGITTIFILGDIFDNRNSINTKVQNDVLNLFNDYFRSFKIYILVGNHDCYFNSSIEINSIKFLGKFENIKIIEKPQIIRFNGKKILLTPWIVDFTEFIQKIGDNKFDLSFGHYNIKGFHYNKVKRSDDGLEGSIFKNKCKLVFSGHFHIRSKQTFGDCNIVYIGSPYQLDRGDIDEERGFVVLDIDDLSYEYINNNVSMKFIKLNYPQEFNEELIKGNIVDIHVKYNNIYLEEELQKYVKKIQDLGPAFSPQIVVETDEFLDPNVDISKLNFSSIPDLMMEYINTIDIKNKNCVYEILMELYNSIK